MSDDIQPAARKTEFIRHDNSQLAKAIGWAVWTGGAAFATARFVSAWFSWTPAGAAIFVGSLVIEWYLGNLVESTLEDFAASHADDAIARVKTGSPNVFVNDLEAVRGEKQDETEMCHNAKVEQGSLWVSINKKPATRWGDRTSCNGGAYVYKNPALPRANTFIGGPKSYYANEHAGHTLVKAIWNIFNVWKAGTYEGLEYGIREGVGIGTQKGLDWFKNEGERFRP
jgi:uncharacterized Zn-binding protein involved in type VI secretion